MQNYLSLWIGNFGVDPWFCNLFFLALPAFFLLSFLLVLVCCVFEAIILPLSKIYILNVKKRPLVLSGFTPIVKAFVPLFCVMTHLTHAEEPKIKEIFLATGEQYQLKVKNLKKYSVGNKDVIRHKYRSSHKQILLKGKRIGFSDLVVWNSKGKLTYHFYVISKKNQLEKMTLVESLKKMDLNLHTQGDLIYAQGKMDKLEEYYLLHKIIKQNHQNFIHDITLSSKLKRKILLTVYSELYQNDQTKAQCKFLNIDLHCKLEGVLAEDPSLNYLKKKYHIKFSFGFEQFQQKNYMAKFQIIQIETTDLQAFHLGFDKIQGQINQIIENSKTNQRSIQIGNQKAHLKVIASPQTALTLNHKANIQLGGELPFSQTSAQGQQTQWKFFGLKINMQLKQLKAKAYLDYKTQMTSPQGRSISGSKGSSSLFIQKGKTQKLFEIGYHITNSQDHFIPYLADIPILKAFFSSEYHSHTYKHIICMVTIKELK